MIYKFSVVFLVVGVVLSQQTFPGKLRKGKGMDNGQGTQNQTNTTTLANMASLFGGMLNATNSTLNSTMQNTSKTQVFGLESQNSTNTTVTGLSNSTDNKTQLFGQTTQTFGKGKGKGSSTSTTMSQDPRSVVHKLFSDHSWYHHAVIVASVFKLQTLPALKTRLLQNAQDIGNGLGSLFPFLQPKSSTISTLLSDHVTAAGNAVNATISKQNLTANTQALYSQGDKVADALAQNLNLPQKQVRTDFHQHNEHVIKLATLLVDHKYGTEYIQELDAFNNQTMQLADVIFSAASSNSNSSEPPASSSSLPPSTSSYYASTSS